MGDPQWHGDGEQLCRVAQRGVRTQNIARKIRQFGIVLI
jgi:hypothetical protein